METEQEIAAEIRKLKNDIKIRNTEIAALAGQVHKLEIQLVKQTIGVEIGSIVMATQGRNEGRLFKVTDIEPWGHGTTWVKGVQKKPDGTYGKRVTPLYQGWQLQPQEAKP